jgi:hypothetical protein
LLETDGTPPMTRLSRFSRFPVAVDRPSVGVIGALVLSGLAYLVRVAVEGIIPSDFPY